MGIEGDDIYDPKWEGKLSPQDQSVWEAMVDNIDVSWSNQQITEQIVRNLKSTRVMGLTPDQEKEVRQIIAGGGDDFFHGTRDSHYPTMARNQVRDDLIRFLNRKTK